ncbi:PadR family transcriptional regulator [Actinomadura rudentiformis]|uniref:PadR family transcriptional regulator n=1 Tax=Actinomadura rudentiformis TaxID=359158 RepID=A0A6H9YJ38_9ACTN|nr:PadR family transcriptional regulator [Actinomadura rudentiformis]KAB2341267.1 PadR family transcriptional regulator [Actinomadura rudentiformis]
MARPITPLALIVLRMLHEQPMHPYELQQQIRIRAYDVAVKLTHGSLYNTVERLAVGGLIEPMETSREGRRPERTVYKITEAGRDAASDRLSDLLGRYVPEFPLFGAGLAVITLLPRTEALVHLRSRAVQLEALVAAEQTVYDALRKRGLERCRLLDGELKIAQLRTELEYVQGLVSDMAAGRVDWEPVVINSRIDSDDAGSDTGGNAGKEHA